MCRVAIGSSHGGETRAGCPQQLAEGRLHVPGVDAVERNAEFYVQKGIGVAGRLHELQAYQVGGTGYLGRVTKTTKRLTWREHGFSSERDAVPDSRRRTTECIRPGDLHSRSVGQFSRRSAPPTGAWLQPARTHQRAAAAPARRGLAGGRRAGTRLR